MHTVVCASHEVILSLCVCTDTLNTQVHEATKHTPYELVFGQPPRSRVIPDTTLTGRIDEEDLAEALGDIESIDSSDSGGHGRSHDVESIGGSDRGGCGEDNTMESTDRNEGSGGGEGDFATDNVDQNDSSDSGGCGENLDMESTDGRDRQGDTTIESRDGDRCRGDHTMESEKVPGKDDGKNGSMNIVKSK